MQPVPVLLVTGMLTLSLFAGVSGAHEFLVKPDRLTAGKGETVTVQAQAAHVFMISDEAEDPDTCQVQLRQGEKIISVPLSVDSSIKALTGRIMLPETGSALLVGHRLPQTWSDTTEGVLEGNRDSLERQGKKVLKVVQYEKFSKTLLNATPGDTSYSTKLGQGLEIVLLTNPATLTKGEELKACVLLHGQPVQTTLAATYDGFSKEPDVYAERVQTGSDGIATLRLSRPGLWMLRAAASEDVNKNGIDKRDLRSTYVFAVK